MTKEEFKEISKGDGIILAYKEGDSIYPILLDREDVDTLLLFMRGFKGGLQVLKSKENEYKRIK